jgi:hypothetical protein
MSVEQCLLIESVCSTAAMDLNPSDACLFVDQWSVMLQAAEVMFCTAPKTSRHWNRDCGCQPSYAHLQMLVEGLGS